MDTLDVGQEAFEHYAPSPDGTRLAAVAVGDGLPPR